MLTLAPLTDIYTLSTAKGDFSGSLADVLVWHASMQGAAATISPDLPDTGSVTLPASVFTDEDDCLAAAAELVAEFVDVEVAKWASYDRDAIIVSW